MNDNILAILSTIGVVLGIAGTLGVIYGYYTMNLSKAQIEALRGDRDDQGARIKRLEGEIEEYKLLRDKDAIEKQELRTQVTVLQGLVTHDSKIEQLITRVNEHDMNVEAKYVEYMEINNKLLRRVDLLLNTNGVDHA